MITVRQWKTHFEVSRGVVITIQDGRVCVPRGRLSEGDKIILGTAKPQLLGDLDAPLQIQRTHRECKALGLVQIPTSTTYHRWGDVTTTWAWTHALGDEEALRILCGDITFEDAKEQAAEREQRARTVAFRATHPPTGHIFRRRT